MDKKFSFNVLAFIRERRNQMQKEWEKDPKAFWASISTSTQEKAAWFGQNAQTKIKTLNA